MVVLDSAAKARYQADVDAAGSRSCHPGTNPLNFAYDAWPTESAYSVVSRGYSPRTSSTGYFVEAAPCNTISLLDQAFMNCPFDAVFLYRGGRKLQLIVIDSVF